MKLKKISVVTLSLAGMFLVFGLASAQVIQTTPHVQDNGFTDPNCVESAPNEWHWLITQAGKAGTLPTAITAHFASGDIQVPYDGTTGGTAHYRLVNQNLNDTLVAPGATAQMDSSAYNNWANVNPRGQLILSHGPCVQVLPLVVEKTANTSLTRTWEWRLEKTADQTDLGTLDSGESATVQYEVTVGAVSADTNHAVDGTITITNPTDNPSATIESVNDVLNVSGAVTNIVCDDDNNSTTLFSGFPYVLAGGAVLTCNYSADVTGTSDSENMATVVTSGDVPGNSDMASVNWIQAVVTKIDECITVNDTNANGPQGVQVCEDDLSQSGTMTFPYAVSFSKDQVTDVIWQCGQTTYVNTASLVTNDTAATEQDVWTVNATVTCLGCSFSQGYWFAKPNVIWPSSITIGGWTYSQAEGKSIWKSSNKGGITDAKKAFLQLAALQLSAIEQNESLPSELASAVDTINAFLTGKPKLTGNNITIEDAAVSSAAATIANWIADNHCSD
ncbi:MAG: hypothetical protein HY461_00510 [Parcubacteria group bacterium]|nr:hypothetical protein [Parcubacteria group bacterium]